MKTYNDTDLRKALRRREAKRPQTEVPADFLDKVMTEISQQERPRHTWRIALASLAAAASVALAVILATGQDVDSNMISDNRVRSVLQQDSTANVMAAAESLPADCYPLATAAEQPGNLTATHIVAAHPSRAEEVPTDSFDHYVAQMESDLADVRDSCYLAQVECMIADNEALQQLMNEITNPQ